MLRIIIPTATIELQKKRISQALRGAGRLVATEAKNLIQNSPGGAGNPPKNRTGKLASSIRTSARKGYVKIISDAPYSTALEVGGAGGGVSKGNRNKRGKLSSKRVLPAHPFMETALNNKKAEIERRVEQAVMADMEWKETKTK
jgi:phage gpG-like protein